MEKKEIRSVLTEVTFTSLCKKGYVEYKTNNKNVDILFNKSNVKELISGSIVEKEEYENIYKFMLQDMGVDIIREILKRSPLFSELSQEI